MSSRSATLPASSASATLQHVLERRAASATDAPVRMKIPTTSYPCCLSKTAATELSTPPLIASTTFLLIVRRSEKPAATTGSTEPRQTSHLPITDTLSHYPSIASR